MKTYRIIFISLVFTVFSTFLSKTSTHSIQFNFITEKPVLELIDSNTIATVYHAVPQECDGDCTHPANVRFSIDLSQPGAHRIIAMERTMRKKYGLHWGDIVYIEGTDHDGYWQIQDTMNKRFAGQSRIDLLVDSSIKTGKWKNVKVYKVKGSDRLLSKICSEYMLSSL